MKAHNARERDGVPKPEGQKAGTTYDDGYLRIERENY